MALLQVPSSSQCEILLNTPNRNEILKDGPPPNCNYNILGRGAYGTVFKAVFKGKQVAVKIVKNLKDINLQSMRSETNVLGWKHRNIVRILKIESTPNFGIVIMERFAGQCLQMILDSIELPLLHRVFISLDVLCALEFCHRRHLLHLDVKPQNILVAFNNQHSQYSHSTLQISKARCYICKLCDFGSSLKLGEQQENLALRSTKGTVRYMSPEALREEPLSAAADFYSLGISMWQLQHRQLPYYWIESNETVAYQVVKINLRPDSDAALLNALNLQNVCERHRNCLCEHFSSEISYHSLEHIKNMLNQTESLGFQEDNTQNFHQKSKKLMRDGAVRVPFRKLSSQTNANVTRNLGTTTGAKAAKRKVSNDDGLLELIFSNSTTSVRQTTYKRELIYETLYKSCWHEDVRRRPNAVELRRGLEGIM